MEDLIYRSRKETLSRSEEEALLAWRRSSPENEARYADTVRLLDAGGAALRAQVPPRPSADAVLRRAAGIAARGEARRWRRPRLLYGALALATAAGLSFLVLRARMGEPGGAASEFVTASGETSTVTLEDGTVVRLAPESRLRVAAAREVRLEGRAYFAVTRAADGKLFRVVTPAGIAEVLGTRFDLQSRGADLRLVVVEGRVALEGDAAPVVVGAGEMSRVSAGAVSTPVEIDVRPLIAWLGGFIVFQETPASEVASELERVYGVRVEIADTTLARHTITGSFADRPFADVFARVCEVLQASCTVHGATATIGSSSAGDP